MLIYIFQWDPMITTLPGLYLISVLMLSPAALLFGKNLIDVCSSENLRACNVVFCICNFMLLYQISKKLADKKVT